AVVPKQGAPVFRNEVWAGIDDCVDVALESQRHNVSLQTVDHGAGLRTRATMRDLDGNGLTLRFLPMLDESIVEFAIKLAGRIIGHVNKRTVLSMRGDGEPNRERGGEGGIGNKLG